MYARIATIISKPDRMADLMAAPPKVDVYDNAANMLE